MQMHKLAIHTINNILDKSKNNNRTKHNEPHHVTPQGSSKTLGIRAKFINETLGSFEGVIEAVADECQKNWKVKLATYFHDQYLFWLSISIYDHHHVLYHHAKSVSLKEIYCKV